MPKHFFIAILTFYLMSTAAVAQASLKLPATVKVESAALTAEPMCDPKISPAWREAQEIDGVKIDASPGCSPDNPVWIAAAVKGTNNISMDTLMKTGLSPDAIIKTDDIDGDGDPDRIIIKLEIMELNGRSPDFPGIIPTFDIAPGVEADMGNGDQWPQIRAKVLDADILLLSTPIWLGHPSSVTQRVLERLDAELSNKDADGRPALTGKVGIVSVVGNEDGAHKVIADVFQALEQRRPYRGPMSAEQIFAVITEEAQSGKLDGDVVALTGKPYVTLSIAALLGERATRTEHLAAHPDVAECAVVGHVDELKGEVPIGFVVLKAGETKYIGIPTSDLFNATQGNTLTYRDQLNPKQPGGQLIMIK